jgi:hypothetical protein
MSSLVLKRASASRPFGEWNDDDYDVLADATVVGRIMKGARRACWFALDVDARLWEDRTPTHGYAATREAAMAVFVKSWRRE